MSREEELMAQLEEMAAQGARDREEIAQLQRSLNALTLTPTEKERKIEGNAYFLPALYIFITHDVQM
jgi:hypothetical protein